MYLATRASRATLLDLYAEHGLVGKVGTPGPTGWNLALVEDTVSAGLLARLVTRSTGDVLLLELEPSGPAVSLHRRDGPATRWSEAQGPGPQLEELVNALVQLDGVTTDSESVRPALLAGERETLIAHALAPVLGFPDPFARPERAVVAYRGPRDVARATGQVSGPCVLGPEVDGWQLLAFRPGLGHETPAVYALRYAPLGQTGSRTLMLSATVDELTVSVPSPPGSPEMPASWTWNPLRLSVPAPDPWVVAGELQPHLPDLARDALAEALRQADPEAFLDLAEVPRAALTLLDADVRDLPSMGEELERVRSGRPGRSRRRRWPFASRR